MVPVAASETPRRTGLTKRAYQLRFRGLEEAPGEIRATTLVRAVRALVRAAERATRLAVTGRSVAAGPRPRWLKEAADLTVSGIGGGSTTLDIRAPVIAAGSDPSIAQRDMWVGSPAEDDTALDLVAKAVAEARDTSAPGDHYDRAVLIEIIELAKAAGPRRGRCELISRDTDAVRVVLDPEGCAQMREWVKRIPKPSGCVVSGFLDEIGHGMGRFRLRMGEGQALSGRVDRTHLDVELLRPFWGTRATIQGVVHFKPGGQPRLLEAHRVSPRVEGDAVFEALPGGVVEGQDVLELPRRSAGDQVSPMILWGAWPGDEPIEELMAELD